MTDNHVLFAILIGKKKKDEPKLHNKVLTRTVIVSIIIERFHNQNNIQEYGKKHHEVYFHFPLPDHRPVRGCGL